MKINPLLIKGGSHSDSRGKMTFNNNFDLSSAVRFYCIYPNENEIRAWQGHKLESKWFLVMQGAFEIKLLSPVNWNHPSTNLECTTYTLEGNTGDVLFVPKGHINGFMALENKSVLMVFSDSSVEMSVNDDYRYSVDYWKSIKWNKV